MVVLVMPWNKPRHLEIADDLRESRSGLVGHSPFEPFAYDFVRSEEGPLTVWGRGRGERQAQFCRRKFAFAFSRPHEERRIIAFMLRLLLSASGGWGLVRETPVPRPRIGVLPSVPQRVSSFDIRHQYRSDLTVDELTMSRDTLMS